MSRIASLVTVIFAVTASSPVPAQSASLSLACGRSETEALVDAPQQSVHRTSEHRLQVTWAKGARVFADSGLEPGGLAGIRYEYCGYADGLHLIGKRADDLFTGVLLDAANGKVLPAGKTVSFAPDATRYFVTQQPDGLDGEEWLIYSRAGAQLWKGESGISAQSAKGNWRYFVATLEQPRWSAGGELAATLRCSADTTQTATVTLRASGGQHQWMPKVECAP